MQIGSWSQSSRAKARPATSVWTRTFAAVRVALLLVISVGLQAAPAWSGTNAAQPESHRAAPVLVGDCVACGKSIYFGERCATCIVKSKLQNQTCTDCDKRILVGERCAMCLLRHVDQGLQHACLDCETTIRVGQRCTSCAAKHLRSRFGQTKARLKAMGARLETSLGARLNSALSRVALTADDAPSAEPGPSATDANPADPERDASEAADALETTQTAAAEAEAIQATETSWRERALAFGQAQKERAALGLAAGADGFGALAERLDLGGRSVIALGAALEVAESIETTKAQLAEAGIERALAISVASDLGETTLGDLAKVQLLRALPELEGTALANDPAAVFAALIVMDPLGFTMDLELVPTEAGPVSIMEALATRGEEDPTMTFAAITLLESIADLKRGQNVTRAMRDISRALDVLVPSEPAQAAPED